ncbi:MAG: hypothetical protein IJK87_08270 [Prevotella sp.]|nr:hypothetical protein [Prevotella sp.]
MKKYVFTICMFMSLNVQLPLYSQQYLPIFEEGKRWVVKWQAADIVKHQTWVISGDTIINDHSYYIVDGVFVREENNKVFALRNGKERTLYDFDLKVGDTFQEDELVVVSVDSIKVSNITRKRIGFMSSWYFEVYKGVYGEELDEENPKNWDVCWIEGIGSSNTPTYYSDWEVIGPRHTMQQCYFNDECIFTYDDFFAKPVSSISNPVSSISVSNAVYDLQGRRVQTPQRGGLYIKDGRKLIYR